MSLIDEIRNGESERLEFKEIPNVESAKWLKTAVAFANCRGGRILFGVTNTGEIKGLDGNLFAMKDAVADALANSCCPPLPSQINITAIDGKPIIVLDVEEGLQTPYYIRAKGDTDGVYVRFDATTRVADEYALQDLRIDGTGRSFDSRECRGFKVTNKEIDALCARMYDVAVENAKNDAERKLVRPVKPAQLVKWGILQNVRGQLRPTNAFALLTDDDHLSPVVKCGLFRGTTRAVFVDRRQFVMAVQDQVEEAYKYVLSKINLGASFPNVHRKDTYEIPPGAIRELIANAVVHRSYVNAEASPITVAIYDDRLEITSPGRLKRGVTVEKMLEGCSDCRNEALALALSYMNIIEDWGSGIPRIRQELKEAGLRDLMIQEWPNAVRTIIYRRSVEVAKGLVNGPAKSLVNGPVKGQVFWDKGSLAGKLDLQPISPTVLQVFERIENQPGCRQNALAQLTGISERRIKRCIAELKKKNLVEFRGAPKNGGYWVVHKGKR